MKYYDTIILGGGACPAAHIGILYGVCYSKKRNKEQDMLNQIIFTTSMLARKLGIDFHEQQDPAVGAMQERIATIGAIEFAIEYYPDGSWSAESKNIDGIITGSTNVKDIDTLLRDAIFTYFKIPPHLCNDQLLQSSHEPVTVAQRVWATR